MKYMLLIFAGTDVTEPECTFEDWRVWDEKLDDAGIKVSGESLADLVTATTVQVRKGAKTVTDGPFAETRELLGGFVVIDVPNLDVALEWAASCPGSHDGGAVEVRPVADLG